MTMFWAIIPVKSLDQAKSSFGEVLDSEERHQLVFCMLEDVLNVVAEVEQIEPIVVTPDDRVAEFAEERGAKVFSEPGLGLIGAMDMVIEESVESGVRGVVYLPGDIPLMKTTDLENILDLTSGDRSVVIAPSEEKGTNALLLEPPDIMSLRLGGESFPDHVAEARKQGVEPEVYRSKTLRRDIDSPEDFLKVETLGQGTRTHSFLNSLKE